MNMLTAVGILRILVMTLGSVYAAYMLFESSKEVRGVRPRKLFLVLFVVINWLLQGSQNPWVHIVALIIISILAFLNKEGDKRAESWRALAVTYFATGALAIALKLDNGGFRPATVVLIILLVVAFIASMVCTKLGVAGDIEEPETAEEQQKRANFVTFTVASGILIAAIVVVGVFAF